MDDPPRDSWARGTRGAVGPLGSAMAELPQWRRKGGEP